MDGIVIESNLLFFCVVDGVLWEVLINVFLLLEKCFKEKKWICFILFDSELLW